MKGTLEQRLWAKVDKRGPRQPHMKTRCWVYTGALRNGYGAIGDGSKVRYAHRVAYKLKHGKYPAACARHVCDHRPCCRPSHLKDGTKRDNSGDMVRRGRSARGEAHGMCLHPERVARGERSGTAKMNWDKVRAIRAAYPTRSLGQLAKDNAMSVAGIHKIVRHETWKE